MSLLVYDGALVPTIQDAHAFYNPGSSPQTSQPAVWLQPQAAAATPIPTTVATTSAPSAPAPPAASPAVGSMATPAAAPMAAASPGGPSSGTPAQVLAGSATPQPQEEALAGATTNPVVPGGAPPDFTYYTGPADGIPTNPNPPFPGSTGYTGPVATQAEAYAALGLPADFVYGGQPDPYRAGDLANWQRDAAAGDAAAQAGLDAAKADGADFSAYA